MATHMRRVLFGRYLMKRMFSRSEHVQLSWTRSYEDLMINTQLVRGLTTTRSLASSPQSDSADSSTGSSSMSRHLLLIIPVAAFGLGTWQVQRRKWKLNLIRELGEKVNAPPVPLPAELAEVEQMEYRRVSMRGEFDHSKEQYILPRSLNNSQSGPGAGFAPMGETGANVVTPFHLADRGVSVLVNRGWIPRTKMNPSSRQEGQVGGVVDLVGIIRLNEQRVAFMPKNDEVRNRWHYKDLDAMSRVAETEPILVDADSDSTVKGGPIGGQTRVSLRNEHMQYIITWYSLSLFTGIMWYYGVLKKRSNILGKR